MMIPDNNPLSRPLPSDLPAIQSPKADSPQGLDSEILRILQPPSPSDVQNKERVISVKSPVDATLLEELMQVLRLQASQIEKEMERLEKTKHVLEMIETSSEVGESLKQMLEVFDKTNEGVQSGVEFLEHVIPEQILAKLPSADQPHKGTHIASLAGALLTALEAGLAEAALIYKMKIIEQSKEIIQLMRQTPGQGTGQQFSDAEIAEMEQSLVEWEMKIQMEQEKVAEATLQTRVSTISTLIYIASYPLGYIPETASYHKYVQAASTAATGLTSVLDTISLTLQLKRTTEEAQLFTDWMDAYVAWKDKHLARASKDLLEKRKRIFEEKVRDLKPRFHAMKEEEFRNEMQRMLNMLSNEPTFSSDAFLAFLEKWGYSATKEGRGVHFAFARLKTNPEDLLFKGKLVDALNKWVAHPTAMHQQFEVWYKKEVPDDKKLEALVKAHIDHQETIEITTKNALKEMVQQKLEIEEGFFNLKLFGTLANLSLAVITLTLSAVLFVLGLLTTPFGGAGVVLMALGTGTAVLGYGLIAGSFALSYRNRPELTKFLATTFFELKYIKLRKWISDYAHQAKETKIKELKNKEKEKEHQMIAAAQNLFDLHIGFQYGNPNETEILKALKAYRKAKREFEESKTVDASKELETSKEFLESKASVQKWNDRLEKMEKTMVEKGWEDFAMNASLQVSGDTAAFDSLRAFQEAFKACDMKLLSNETKDLLKFDLGIDLVALQAQLEKDPAKSQSDEIQNALQKFFAMTDESLIVFIEKQRQRIEAGVLRAEIA